jgi:hypothetical protein
MRWKEFLKPTWKKILIFTALIVVYGYILFLVNSVKELYLHGVPGCALPLCTNSVGLPWYPCPTCLSLYDYLYLFVYLPSYVISTFDINNILLIPSVIVNLFYLYLISCLIVWIYNKIKKK